MNNPSIEEGIGIIKYDWPELGLRVIAERVTHEGSAELQFLSVNSDGESLLHTTRVNLLSTTTMNSLMKRLERNSQEFPWTEILTFITGKTLEIVRRGEPVEEIWPREDDVLAPQYLLDPVLYQNHPTVFFGDYGSAKSLIALVMAYVVQLPFDDNSLGLTTLKESTLCLYLDYEDDHDSFRRRWSALEQGLGKGAMPISYKRMTSPLADDLELVQDIIKEKNIKLVIVDSLGPAARGNLNDPEPAIKYHSALRRLNTTSLTLAHNAKDNLTTKRTIFGSVFFTNLARQVWECKAEQEVGEDDLTISLRHIKANLSKLQPPLGFHLDFEGNAIKVNKTDLKDTGLSGELPIAWQIKNLLRQGPLTAKGIAEALEKNEGTIAVTLNRMEKKGSLVKLPEHNWGLKEYRDLTNVN